MAPSTPRRPGDRRGLHQGLYLQLTALFLLALKLGQLRGRLDPDRSVALIEELSRIPHKIEEVLRGCSPQCEQLAKEFSNARDFLYLGRGIHFPLRWRER